MNFVYDDVYCCNKCDYEFEWNWTDSWGEDNADNFRSAKLKKRQISINEGRCYFCNRTEKDWGGIHNEIITNLKKELDSTKGGSDSHSKQAKKAISSFKKIWSKVNGRHKVGTLMSDPQEFLPPEIGKYWSDDWEGEDSRPYASSGPFADYFEDLGAESSAWMYHHPEWFSLERLCLEWLFDYYYSSSPPEGYIGSGKRKKDNPDVRVNNIEKKMLKEITETFEENYGLSHNRVNDEGEEWDEISIQDRNKVDSMLIERLISLQEGHSSLRRFTWKPWDEESIRGANRNQYGDRFSSDRSEILAVDTWICPMCYDRFQMQ